MKILKAKDYDGMSRIAANIISAQVILKDNCVLGLATGSSPVGVYQRLIELCANGELDFSRVVTVNLDEYRGLPVTNEQSYRYFMNDNLFNHINIKPENTNVPNGTAPDPAAECARYENLIHALGGIDLQLLGIGNNGHIGFNEPSDAFDCDTHCVDLTESTIEANKRFFSNADEVPRQAYTMGMKAIMQARRIVMVVSGAAKAEIVKAAVCGPITPRVPASILQLHKDVTLVGDEAALSLL